MVFITEEMVRKRSEHNELQISTLEEISLHQQDIEKLECLDKWCKDLKILYLQSNLIPKIENVSKLKKLEYLNLALNNVEKVENLEGCESLRKLDLTVNFVGELTSIECLKDLYNFRELFLTGNPCTDYEHYREYVIATLPQLQWLDGVEIEKSERIQAVQNLPFIRGYILEQQDRHKKKRNKEKAEAAQKQREKERHEELNKEPNVVDKKDEENDHGKDGRWYTDINEGDKRSDDNKKNDKTHEEKVDEFWNEKTGYTPESRLEVHNHLKELKEKDDNKCDADQQAPRKMFAEDGRPYNVNEPKVDFSLTEDDENVYIDVAIFKHMDTALLDCDVQPTYARITLKGMVLQLALPEEVNSENSTAKRSQTTGHLVVTMPKTKQVLKPKTMNKPKQETKVKKEEKSHNDSNVLEVDANLQKGVDISSIVTDNETKRNNAQAPFGGRVVKTKVEERPNSEGFIDDPDVPPLL